MDRSFFLGWWKCPGISGDGYATVNTLKTTELYALKVRS